MFKKSFVVLMLLGLVFLLPGCSNESFNLADFEFPNPELPAVLIHVENHGTIIAELYPEYAPITVNNFINLVEDGFYDGLTFHRIMSGFMIQGGCPQGSGMGGAGSTITGEFADNDIENPLLHTRGVLSMARAEHDYNSASSQFFIMHEDSPFLNGGYASFGRVIHGMDVVDSIVDNVTPVDNNGTIDQDEQPVITEISIVN